MKLINIHTHHPLNSDEIQLVNCQLPKELPSSQNAIYSIGLHPWDLENIDIEDLFSIMLKWAPQENVIAIGECGIDRFIKTSIELQEKVFTRQVELAEELNKPLIIHAVKSYPDMIRIKKDRKKEIPWILHGYNGNKQTTEQLKAHNFHFSIGPQLLKSPEKLLKSIELIPLEKLFFETDDSHESIETIYIFAAEKSGISLQELKTEIYSNYKRVFKNG